MCVQVYGFDSLRLLILLQRSNARPCDLCWPYSSSSPLTRIFYQPSHEDDDLDSMKEPLHFRVLGAMKTATIHATSNSDHRPYASARNRFMLVLVARTEHLYHPLRHRSGSTASHRFER
ncbi:hypothetical protein C8T65DRAFT_65568 [Cerioporus squamosus]|nr:hypothetical protein C8T65DRAFT_65568 [Cerioporus squamosus]